MSSQAYPASAGRCSSGLPGLRVLPRSPHIPRAPSGEKRPWEVLKLRDFRLLWTANAMYFAAQQVSFIALQWFVLELGSSKTLLGLAAATQGMAVLLISPIGGVIAERTARRDLLIAGRVGLLSTTLVMAVLVALGAAALWQALLSAAVTGVFVALTQPATQTFLYDVVGAEWEVSAITVNASATSIFNVAGPAVGGILIASVGIAGAYAFGGVGYFIGLPLMALIPVAGRTKNLKRLHPLVEMREGFAFMQANPLMRWLLGLSLVSVVGSFIYVLRPVYARDVFNVGAAGLGVMGAFFGAGALVSAFAMTFLVGRIQRQGLALLLITVLWDVGMVLFALSQNFVFSLIVQFFMGMVGPLWQAMMQTILQTSAPPQLRSRVMSVYFMAMQGTYFGQFLGGALADLLGNTWPLLIAAGTQLAALGLTFLFSASIRTFRASARVRQPVLPATPTPA